MTILMIALVLFSALILAGSLVGSSVSTLG
jgi:hypothetical protein